MLKATLRGVFWVLTNPFPKIALVLGSVLSVLSALDTLFTRLAGDFLGQLYQIPINALANWIADSSNTLLSWLCYVLALDWVIKFLHILPNFIWYLINALIAVFVSVAAWCVVNFFRDLVGKALNEVFP